MFLVKSIDETMDLITKHFSDYSTKTIKISLENSCNYVCAENIKSHEDVPHFNRSIVDGYAVDFNSVKLASATTPAILNLIGEVEMGEEAKDIVNITSTVYVPTGGHLPKGANCAVMIENTEMINNEVFIYKSSSIWENVLLQGSDIEKGTVLLKENTLITPLVIGALKSIGIKDLLVYEKIKVTIISTGDEIVDDTDTLKIGEIRDINTYTIKNYLEDKNFIVNNTYIIRDNFKEYKDAVMKSFEDSDIVFTSGGSSVGDKDYTYQILQEMGAEILVHGINIKPGKPTIIAKYNNKLFFGLPGQPTSAYFVLNAFTNHIENTFYNFEKIKFKPYIEAILGLNVHSVTGRRMYQMIKLSYNENKELLATPLFAKSGMINSLKEADGYIIISEFIEGLIEGEKVKVYRLGD